MTHDLDPETPIRLQKFFLWSFPEMVVQADVEDGTGGIKCSCSLVKSIQVKAV